MITKTIIKDYVLKKCSYLTSLELEDKSLIGLLKEFIQAKNKLIELAGEELELDSNADNNDDFDLYELLKDYPHLKKEIIEFEKSFPKNPVEKLIEKYYDNQLISKVSRSYIENIYGKSNCRRCDVDEFGNDILEQSKILSLTNTYLNDKNVKVIFEGQLEYKNLRARFDILIKNNDQTFDIIEVKGTTNIFHHLPKNSNVDTKINSKYLYDLLFQYYVYKNAGLKINNVGYMYINSSFKLNKEEYPMNQSQYNEFFVIKDIINLKNGPISLKDYFDDKLYIYKYGIPSSSIECDSIEEIIEAINNIGILNKINPIKKYECRKTPKCPFMEFCFKDSCSSNSIFKLTNWNEYGGNYNKTIELLEKGIDKISDIPCDAFKEFNDKGKRLNVYNQIRYQKNEIKEKYVIDKAKIKEILASDYLNSNIKWLIFFDFESFQHCIPLVYDSNPWKQVVSQYSMHVVNTNYDLSKHDFDNGIGGNIYHFEFIGNPDIDGFTNPSIMLYKELKKQLESIGINPLGNDYKVVVFNKNFEESRMKDFINNPSFNQMKDLMALVDNFKNNIVDLLDFFTSGAIYSREFNGRGSLKVVQPTFAMDRDVINYYNNILKFDFSDSLDYHKNDTALVYNGAICLDLYKSLLIRSHLGEENNGLSTKELLKEALAYCKIDSWGTVIIFDIIKNLYEGKLKLDCLEL